MTFTQHYDSPLGSILLTADEMGLTGLWFDGQKHFARDLPFTGREPDFLPALHPIGSAFRRRVWDLLLRVPYGQAVTYGQLAQQLAAQQSLSHMSAQAVGGAVGHNAISIIIPCHRVVGAGGSLTGYAGGIDRKVQLLTLEHADTSGFFVPKKSTAP